MPLYAFNAFQDEKPLGTVCANEVAAAFGVELSPPPAVRMNGYTVDVPIPG